MQVAKGGQHGEGDLPGQTRIEARPAWTRDRCTPGAVIIAPPSPRPPALLFDVMSTLVHDPLFSVGPALFGGDLRTLFARLDREAFFAFERGELDEAGYFARWLRPAPIAPGGQAATDSGAVRSSAAQPSAAQPNATGPSAATAGDGPDPATFLAAMAAGYAWLPGVEALLSDLRALGFTEVHAFSNYPPWWQTIEARLGLSRHLRWTAVSCLTGLRKPDPAAYLDAARRVGRPPSACVFVDDRPENVAAARAVGMMGVVCVEAETLRAELGALLAPWGGRALCDAKTKGGGR